MSSSWAPCVDPGMDGDGRDGPVYSRGRPLVVMVLGAAATLAPPRPFRLPGGSGLAAQPEHLDPPLFRPGLPGVVGHVELGPLPAPQGLVIERVGVAADRDRAATAEDRGEQSPVIPLAHLEVIGIGDAPGRVVI